MQDLYNHFKNIEELYGDAYVQIPNSVFDKLSRAIKNEGRQNIRQISFAYTYLITISILYKYAHFVDLDNKTYIQNGDIKRIMGYGDTTKTVDKIIKKNGILEDIGLVQTTTDFPIHANYCEEEIDGLRMRNFTTINMIDRESNEYIKIKEIVKNRNYTVKEPLFFFEVDNNLGTLYNYERTHKVTIREYLTFIFNSTLDNISFAIYCYLKSKCFNYKFNTNNIALNIITSELGIGADTFYKKIGQLKNLGYLKVEHKGWKTLEEGSKGIAEANEYRFIGVC